MPTFINMGGVIFTGDMMALGRGRSLELFTEETIRTGPLPIPPPPPPATRSPPVSMVSSSSEPLERSLAESPDSLLLEVTEEVVEPEEERGVGC